MFIRVRALDDPDDMLLNTDRVLYFDVINVHEEAGPDDELVDSPEKAVAVFRQKRSEKDNEYFVILEQSLEDVENLLGS